MGFKKQKASYPKSKSLPIEKSVGAVVINPTGKYLLLDRIANRGVKIKGHWWEISKGHQEGRESDMETLMREIEEECGIKSFEIIKGFKAQTSYISSSQTKRLFVLYLIRLADNRVRLSDEHKDYKWVSEAQARKLLPHKSWVRILMKADRYLKGRENVAHTGLAVRNG
ncbi:MAG: NUDIX domain-containing protein [Candidatus Micrarchaeota archaeon]|nr:NUDIX domain-containing protein [Candidatus Micrarchaeota archaeon]